jgi:glyoxylase-like metal-dependent hydrolase (beta-lactamase superfamily II)
MAAAAPLAGRRLWAAQERYPVAAREPWGRLEEVADGIWAMISTPLEDRTTLCNGGIIRGRAGVLVIEAFGSDEGARWMAERARDLTGRLPTHVVLTHYHSDHTTGLRGSVAQGDPEVLATDATRSRILERNQDPPAEILDGIQVLDGRRPTEIDLGGRSVVVVPRAGHTASDVSLEVQDPPVVFTGDLVWNGMFPNYMDARPSRLAMAVRLLRERRAGVYVPGHGSLADLEAMDRYMNLLDSVEDAARRALERGMTAEEAGEEYSVPDELGEWLLFNPRYFATAIGAWINELEKS